MFGGSRYCHTNRAIFVYGEGVSFLSLGTCHGLIVKIPHVHFIAFLQFNLKIHLHSFGNIATTLECYVIIGATIVVRGVFHCTALIHSICNGNHIFLWLLREVYRFSRVLWDNCIIEIPGREPCNVARSRSPLRKHVVYRIERLLCSSLCAHRPSAEED